MESNKELLIPGTNQVIRPGYKIKLGRFETTVWSVGFGWYSNAGNRPCCGWYLTSEYDRITKPLQLTDLDDVYLVDMCPTEDDFGRSVEAIDKEIIDARLGADSLLYPSLGDSIRCQISNILKTCTSIVPLQSLKEAPLTGEANTLYIDLAEKVVYIWIEDEYVPISSIGDKITESDKNGHLSVNGEDIEVYCPPPVDDAVSEKSNNAVQSKAVHAYVDQEISNIETELTDINNILEQRIMYEIIE